MPESHSKKTRARMNGNTIRKGSTLSKEQKERISTSQVGSHWYNNGEVNVFRKTCPEGFVEGRIGGWKISEEHKKKISMAMNKRWSEKKMEAELNGE